MIKFSGNCSICNGQEFAGDYVVHTEYGENMWKQIVQVGLQSVYLFGFVYPAALVLNVNKAASLTEKGN